MATTITDEAQIAGLEARIKENEQEIVSIRAKRERPVADRLQQFVDDYRDLCNKHGIVISYEGHCLAGGEYVDLRRVDHILSDSDICSTDVIDWEESLNTSLR